MSTAFFFRSHKRWWIAASLFGLYLAMLAFWFLFARLNPLSPQATSSQVSLLILFGAYAAVGVMLIAKRPSNPIGWIFYNAGMLSAFSNASLEYARYVLVTNPGSLPYGFLVGLLSNVALGLALFPMFAFLPLLYPTGKPPSPRWRWLGWLICFGLLVLTVSSMLVPTIRVGGQEQLRFGFENPIGIPGARELLANISSGAFMLVLVSACFSALSLLFRYRRAAGQERAQIRWFAYAVAINVGYVFIDEVTLFVRFYEPVSDELDSVLFTLVFMIVPVATALAIFKYRLWDIDVIIRKTLVYGALTLTLALIYFGSVILLQSLVTAIGGQQSAVITVISTLLIAALFTPLRRRIQGDIDRRFYRKKYDAEKTVAAFSAGLRQEVDLAEIGERLLSVVEETVQPESVTLWLRPVKRPPKVEASLKRQ